MSPSLEYLERCAAETGFQVTPLEKVVRLGVMAADVARHPFFGSVLALKGGTTLNLCFEAPLRLSVDLDFNYMLEISVPGVIINSDTSSPPDMPQGPGGVILRPRLRKQVSGDPGFCFSRSR